MLRNDKYRGTFIWNKRQFFTEHREDGTRVHRVRLRTESEWISKERPDLALIDPALWRRVQLRLGPSRKGGTKTRQHAGRRPSALAGMLVCGVSGHGMQIAGQGKGGAYRNFKCAANHSKGAEVCPSGATISEGKALAALAATIRNLTHDTRFFEPLLQRFTATFTRLLAEQTNPKATPATDAEKELRRQRAVVEKLVDALATVGVSAALAERLRTEEARLAEIEARRAAAPPPARPPKAPAASSAARLRALFAEVEEALARPQPPRGSIRLNRSPLAKFTT